MYHHYSYHHVNVNVVFNFGSLSFKAQTFATEEERYLL